MQQKKKKTNYSWRTSLPAYYENKFGKDLQCKVIRFIISRHRGQKATLKEIQDYLRDRIKVRLPQSTISGRVNDLKDQGKIGFFGELKEYKGRLRKVFELITRQRKKKVIRKTRITRKRRSVKSKKKR